jgi:hypothetical protein
MEHKMAIEAKVATILDATRVALNAGSQDGVEVGSDVTLWQIVTVRDPDGGDDLGNVRLDAATLTVTTVENKFCIASTKVSTNLLFNFTGTRRKFRERGAGGRAGSDDIDVLVGDLVTIETPTHD